MLLIGDLFKLSKAFPAQGQQGYLADNCVVQARFKAIFIILSWGNRAWNCVFKLVRVGV